MFAFVGCKTPSTTAAGGESVNSGSTNSSATTSTTDATSTATTQTTATPGVDFPFEKTLNNVEASTTDGRKITISVSYKGKVKPTVVNQGNYIPQTMEPLVSRACIKVCMSRTAEQLGEEYWATVRSDIFREVSNSINPTEVSVSEVKLLDLTIVR